SEDRECRGTVTTCCGALPATTFGHSARFCDTVKPFARAGDRDAVVGSTGSGSGTHVAAGERGGRCLYDAVFVLPQAQMQRWWLSGRARPCRTRWHAVRGDAVRSEESLPP